MNLNKRQTATVLAALRYWQRHQANIVGNTSNKLPEDSIATDHGTIEPMRANEIDALCDEINGVHTFTVHVLVIEHRHGSETSVHATHDLAKEAILAWCKDWWAKEVGDEEMPEDSEALIKRYFEKVDDESADITACSVET